MLIDGALHVDNSILKATARCSTEALLRYGLDYTTIEERAELKSGDAGHQAMACWFRGGTEQEALAIFSKVYREWADANVPPDSRLTHENCHRVLIRWFETHPLSAMPFIIHPELIEIGFAYPLDDSGEFIFVGRMDGIVTSHQFGMPWTLEHKFTGQITDRWARQFRIDSQNSGYNWAAQNHIDSVVGGSFINAIQLSRLPSSDRKCKDHGVPYVECGDLHAKWEMFTTGRTPQAIEEWKRTAIHLAKRYRDLILRYPTIDHLQKVRMQGMFHGACNYCAFFDFCVTGRQKSMIEAMLVKDPWHPWLFAQGKEAATGRLP